MLYPSLYRTLKLTYSMDVSGILDKRMMTEMDNPPGSSPPQISTQSVNRGFIQLEDSQCVTQSGLCL